MSIKKLIIPIFGCVLLLTNCGPKRINPYYQAQWVYVNSTEHTIEVKGHYYSFILSPGISHTLNLDGGGADIADHTYQVPYIPEQTIVCILGEPWKVLMSGGILDRDNYAVEKITTGIGGWKFTYIFTDADLVAE